MNWVLPDSLLKGCRKRVPGEKILPKTRKLFFFKTNLFSFDRNFLQEKEVCSVEKKIVF
jgi:hypothetical protein